MSELSAKLRLQLIDEVSAAADQVAASLEQVEAQAEEVGASGGAALERFESHLDQAGAAATQLSNRTRMLGESTRAAQLGFANFGTASSAASAQAARSVSSFGSASGAAFAGATTAAGRMTKASRAQAFALAGNVNVVAELGYAFGQLSPATRGLGMAMAGAGGSAFALAGTFGTMGVVVGALVGIIPGLIDLMSRLGTTSASSAEAIKKANEEYQRLRTSIRAAAAERRRLEDIESGRASVRDIQDEIRVRTEQRRQARGRVTEVQRARQTRESRRGITDFLFGQGTGAVVEEAVLGRSLDIVLDQAETAAQRQASEAERVLARTERGLPTAEAREAREARERDVATVRQREQAVGAELEDRIRRRLGPGEEASRLTGALRSSATSEGRVQLSGAAARTFQRLPESERAELEELATTLQGVRERRVRDEQALRARQVIEARESVDEGRAIEQTLPFDPGVDIETPGGAGGGAGADSILQRYIAAQADDPTRQEQTELLRELVAQGREGGRTAVDVRVSGRAEEATVSSQGGPPVSLDIGGDS